MLKEKLNPQDTMSLLQLAFYRIGLDGVFAPRAVVEDGSQEGVSALFHLAMATTMRTVHVMLNPAKVRD